METKNDNYPLIITNRMYCGSYLKEGENIGHEVINTYLSDNGNHYIYLNDTGKINDKDEVKDAIVLLTRYFSPRTYEIIAKARVKDVVADKETFEYTYGGQKLKDIFSNNIYHGVAQKPSETIYATFLVDEFKRPKHAIYITDDVKKSVEGKDVFYIKQTFGKETMRQYFRSSDSGYSDLGDIIKSDIWSDGDAKKVLSPSGIEKKKDCFLSIIKKQDNELVWSNLLAYIFESNKQLCADFFNKKCNTKLSENFNLVREMGNIDLLIYDNDNVIVIENKIKSEINGVKKTENNKGIVSQLSKYYNLLTKGEDEDSSRDQNQKFNKIKDIKTKRFLILMPNYHAIDKKIYKFGEKYEDLLYGDILDFYKKHKNEMEGVKYFNEFLDGLIIQSKEYDDELEKEMKRRFRNAIYMSKSKLTGQG